MAIIKCPECGKDISDMAKTCPTCGYPIGENPKSENGFSNSTKTMNQGTMTKLKSTEKKSKN